MPIHLLPEEVASQIAAGEVVERPASVVKELLENAIDADASYIKIQVEGAGKRLVEVSDDGGGIPTKEVTLAVTRHATSKLDQVEDLFNIRTLGFRGEALASIASVSRMVLTSRTAESTSGVRLQIEGGITAPAQAVGSPQGTTIRVEDLFYNVPARLKFLKNDRTEKRHIDTLVTRYALAYADIRFHLVQDGRLSLQTSGNGDQREVLGALYGVDVARQMLEVLAAEDGIQIAGFVSPTSLTRSNRREIIFYVNKRPVQDTSLAAAVIQAYHTLLMVGRYPMCLLMIEMAPEMVDVNVHPTKAEVRFKDPSRVFSAVQRAVRRALLAHSPVPGIGKPIYWQSAGGAATEGIEGAVWNYPLETGGSGIESSQESESGGGAVQPGFSRSLGHAPILRLIGQVARAYLVAEGPDGLYLIDQHAAHERVLYEKMAAQVKDSQGNGEGIAVQRLLDPVPVELTPARARLLDQQSQILGRLGFEVEEFGANTFLVRSLPVLLMGMDPAAALHVLVEDFEEDETPLGSELEARIIARICKRAAVKAGQVLSPEEQRTLLIDLEACSSPRTCPHGRPTMIHLSVDLLERQFGRKGAR